MRGWFVLALLSTSWLSAQTEHKDKATDYPFHATAGRIAIGADYLIHSIPIGSQTLVTKDYLVVEVAVFPAFAEPINIGSNTFKLRLNGQKFPLTSVAPGFVAASLKYPDWEQHPVTEVSAGMGDANVIIGRPVSVGRFPGDPTDSETHAPHPPRVPTTGEQAGIERERPESIDQVISRTALLEGPADRPVSGFLYFPYKGKIKSLKSIELIFEVKDASVTVKLL